MPIVNARAPLHRDWRSLLVDSSTDVDCHFLLRRLYSFETRRSCACHCEGAGVQCKRAVEFSRSHEADRALLSALPGGSGFGLPGVRGARGGE